MEDRGESRAGDRVLGGEGDAADPQPRQPLRLCSRGDAAYDRPEHSLAPVRRQGHAVPDVGLTLAWPDLEVDLADPFGTARKPPIAQEVVARPGPEAAAAA